MKSQMIGPLLVTLITTMATPVPLASSDNAQRPTCPRLQRINGSLPTGAELASGNSRKLAKKQVLKQFGDEPATKPEAGRP